MAESHLGEVLELIRASSSSDRQKILETLAADGDVGGSAAFRAADVVNRQIDIISADLGVTADEAALLLGRGNYSAGVDWAGLTERVAAFIDTNWPQLEPNLERLSLLVGRQGERLLKQAEKLANQARRQRGAVALQLVWELTDRVRSEMIAEAAKETTPNLDYFNEGELLRRVKELAEPILEDYLGAIGKQRDEMVLGCLTGAELKVLNNCKRYVIKSGKRYDSGDDFREEVWRVYAFCKKRGYTCPTDRQRKIDERKRQTKLNTLSNAPQIKIDAAQAARAMHDYQMRVAVEKGLNPGSAHPAP